MAWTLYNFACMMFDRQKYSEAGGLHVLGRCLLELGDTAAALPMLKESLELRRKTLPANHWLPANSESVLGDCMARMRRFAQAELPLVGSHRRLAEILGPEHPRTHEALIRVVRFYETAGRSDQAAEYRRRIPGSSPGSVPTPAAKY